MPLFDYKCNKCKEVTEVLQIDSKNNSFCFKCPKCDNIGGKRLINNCNHKIKGYCYKNTYG